MNSKRQGFETIQSLAFFLLICSAGSAMVNDTRNNTRLKTKAGAKDWPQWGGTSERNNAPETGALPATFNIKTRENLLWWTELGSESYGGPVVANGKVFVGTTMHRTCGTVAIKNNLLFVADFGGMLHCLNAKTGVSHWTYDLQASSWASPLIADGKVFFVDEDGDVLVTELSDTLAVLSENNLGSACYTTPIVANDTIFICSRNKLFAFRLKIPPDSSRVSQ
jgi:outer membrane protein assembly factor BamB